MPLQLTSPAACQIIGEPDNAYLMKRPDATECVSIGLLKGDAFFISGRSVFRSQTFIAVDQSDSCDSGVQRLLNRRLILVKELADMAASN